MIAIIFIITGGRLVELPVSCLGIIMIAIVIFVIIIIVIIFIITCGRLVELLV